MPARGAHPPGDKQQPTTGTITLATKRLAKATPGKGKHGRGNINSPCLPAAERKTQKRYPRCYTLGRSGCIGQSPTLTT